jgi:DNA helicase-2/ATP-dependent DNA helicase PcrA
LWLSLSNRALYTRAAEDLRDNEGQWAAYDSTGNCVILAGPGSGKTKTLTLKLARILAEDVEPPRGVACITYNNECARELEVRLDQLGVEPGSRVFIGTVHSFSLTQIVLPYAKTAGLGLPDEFRVATAQEQKSALEDAYRDVIKGPDNPQYWSLRMGNYRRRILNRDATVWRQNDPQLAALVESYEGHLRSEGLIDFDDMPLLAVRALRDNEWLQRAILAKFPVLAVDEYQDLGRALHRMVLGLCFSAGIRLIAVGDVDQSIYGFTGANPLLLQQLAARGDVSVVRLRLNYRCGSDIIAASSYALGEARDYTAPDDASQGTIFFHPCPGTLARQADYLFTNIWPAIAARVPGLMPGHVAVLYATAAIGNAVNDAALRAGFETLRTDGNAIYPRSNKLMRWLEACAVWCCGGWQSGAPRFSKVCSEGCRFFAESVTTDGDRLSFQRALMEFLWNRRDGAVSVHDWLAALNDEILADLTEGTRTAHEELQVLSAFIERTSPTGDLDEMTLSQFAGQGTSEDRVNLSTLHSAKGREFQVVILFGMDQGTIPRNQASPQSILESRRLFYVGFTRAKSELHLMHSASSPSRFVREVQARLQAWA